MSRYEYSRDENIERSASALERIADTLDDYIEMSFAAQEAAKIARGGDPLDILDHIVKVIEDIRQRRAER